MKIEIQYARDWLYMIALSAVVLSGCSSTGQTRESNNSNEETNGKAHAAKKGGAQLWAERCTQCHYARDPGTFSPEQWEIIMLHMRIRANLTASEHQALLEFLKSAN